MCMIVGHSDMSKFPRGSWQGSFTVYSKQWKSSLNFKAIFWTKKCFERIPSRPKFACKFVYGSSVFQSLKMHCHVFCNLADSSSIKTNQEIMIFTAKNKLHAFRSRSGIQVQAFRRKLKKLTKGYLAAKKSLRLKQRFKKIHLMVNYVCDQILSKNVRRNVNNRN